MRSKENPGLSPEVQWHGTKAMRGLRWLQEAWRRVERRERRTGQGRGGYSDGWCGSVVVGVLAGAL